MKALLLIVLAAAAYAQTTDGGPRKFAVFTVATLPSAATWSGYTVDVNDALTVGSCTVGGGTEVARCRSNGTIWVSIGGGAAAGLSTTRTSSTVLAVAAGIGRIGTVVTSYAAATGTLSGASAASTAYIYIDSAGLLTMGHNGATTLTCSGCTTVTGVTAFPAGSIPIATATYATALWDVSGITDRRATVSRSVLTPGSGISITENAGGDQTIGNDSTMLPKATLQAGTPQYCRSTTGNDTYTCILSPVLTAYTTGGCLILNPNTANTLTATLAVDGLAAKSILNRAVAALATGDITANAPITICYDGTQFIIQGDGGGAAYTKIQEEVYFHPGGATNDAATAVYSSILCDTTTGCTPGTISAGARVIGVSVFNDAGATRNASIYYKLPANWDAGTVSLDLTWLPSSGTGANMVWSVETKCFADAEDMLSTTYNTAQTATTAVPALGLRTTTTIASLTMTGCAAGETLLIRPARASGNASDVFTANINLFGAMLSFKSNLTN